MRYVSKVTRNHLDRERMLFLQVFNVTYDFILL